MKTASSDLSRVSSELELFKRMTENAKDMIYRMSLPDGLYEYVSPASIEITGYSPEDFYSKPLLIRDLIHPDWRAYFVREWERLLHGDVPATYDYVILHKDGSERYINQRNVLVRDENGIPVALEGILTDVTENKQAEERLKQAHRRLENIIEFLPDAILIIDSDKRIIAWNRAIEIMTGVSKEEMLGRHHHEASAPFYGFAGPYLVDYVDRDIGGELPRYGNIKREGDTLSAEAYAPALYNGKGAYIWAIASPLYDSDGSAIGIIESIRDITERKRLAEEREKLEMQLAQSRKMESIGTLAGGIAHDFNNILSAIFGFCELALEDISEPEKAKSAIQEIKKAAERAKGLVRQILTFSRKNQTPYAPVALPDVVRESLALLRSAIPATVEIRQDLVDSGWVLSDPTQIHQILMNLSTNAVQAMNAGKGVLSVRLQRVKLDGTRARELEVEPGNYLTLVVQDNGSGIPPEMLERIFEPYFTTKETGHGTGLGLSVVHGIVKSHKGAIVCNSNVGRGTTFEVYLPEIESDGIPSQPERKDALPAGAERILFIDDEAALAELAQKTLGRLGYQMTVRTSSVEALHFFQKDPWNFDLVITDMTMPILSGDKLAEQILRVRPDIPIILCTGYNENINEEKAKEIGIRAFLLKPLQFRELAAIIRKVLDKA